MKLQKPLYHDSGDELNGTTLHHTIFVSDILYARLTGLLCWVSCLFPLVSPGSDHRFTAVWRDNLPLRSLSRVFDRASRDSVKDKLQVVHTYAWKGWADNLSMKRAYQLDSSQVQEGGKIPDNVLQDLYEFVATLPDKKKFKRGQ